MQQAEGFSRVVEAPPRNLREQQRAFREQTIVDEAARLLAEVGCDTLSMDQIAQRLGTSKAALYRHFTSKDALLRRAVQEAVEQAIRDARAVAEGSPSQDAMRAAARSLVESWLRTGGAGSAETVACCLAKVECPYADWRDVDDLLAEVAKRTDAGVRPKGGIALTRALRALAAVAMQRVKVEARPASDEDVEAVLDYLFT